MTPLRRPHRTSARCLTASLRAVSERVASVSELKTSSVSSRVEQWSVTPLDILVVFSKKNVCRMSSCCRTLQNSLKFQCKMSAELSCKHIPSAAPNFYKYLEVSMFVVDDQKMFIYKCCLYSQVSAYSRMNQQLMHLPQDTHKFINNRIVTSSSSTARCIKFF